MEPAPLSPALAGGLFTTRATWEALCYLIVGIFSWPHRQSYHPSLSQGYTVSIVWIYLMTLFPLFLTLAKMDTCSSATDPLWHRRPERVPCHSSFRWHYLGCLFGVMWGPGVFGNWLHSVGGERNTVLCHMSVWLKDILLNVKGVIYKITGDKPLSPEDRPRECQIEFREMKVRFKQ